MMALCAAAILTACSKSPEELLSEQLKLGQKYLEELNYEAAIVAYKKAIELEPRAERAYLDLSWILVQQEEFDEAIEVLQEGLEMMPENENLLQICHTCECIVANGHDSPMECDDLYRGILEGIGRNLGNPLGHENGF